MELDKKIKKEVVNMYNNLKVSESNSLKAVIEELLEWCEKKEKEGELGRTFFNEPITVLSRTLFQMISANYFSQNPLS